MECVGKSIGIGSASNDAMPQEEILRFALQDVQSKITLQSIDKID
jgi:hypothetical protein